MEIKINKWKTPVICEDISIMICYGILISQVIETAYSSVKHTIWTI